MPLNTRSARVSHALGTQSAPDGHDGYDDYYYYYGNDDYCHDYNSCSTDYDCDDY